MLNIRREIKRFKEKKDPDDNYFAFTFKQAGKEASSLQKQLQTACDALEDICIDNDSDFDEEFLDNIMSFSRAAATTRMLATK